MFARTLTLGIGLAAAVLASQLPEFAQQYRQRLGGAADELRRVVAAFDRDAAASGLDRAGALQRMTQSGDGLARRQALSMESHIDRLGAFQSQLDAMSAAGPFQRVAIFLSSADPEVSERVMATYEPAVPTTSEGLVAAGGGFLACLGLARLLRALRNTHPARWPRRRTRLGER